MKPSHQPHRLLHVVAWVVACFVTTSVFAENESEVFPGLNERFEAADSEGVTATRDKSALYLAVDADVKGPIKIPRLAAPLVSIMWQGSITDDGLSLKPEPNHWVIRWKSKPADAATLVLQFGDEPLLIEESKPIKKSSDGSFYLPAHRAVTMGEKIRYEPQPFKNTVGFWAGQNDSATWSIKLDKPGRFNVAVLQGCGKGQGGSTATAVVTKREEKPAEQVHEINPVLAMLAFEVMETGHWQNFQWRQLGVVEIRSTDEIELTIMPKEIKKAALMDIRAIHLIRLPDEK